MPFRPTFDCLWCGRSWTSSGGEALEGWAQLCPDCLGRAAENRFLRIRVRTAIAERASGGVHAAATATGTGVARSEQRPSTSPGEPADDEWDDWYLRRGRFSGGPVHDAAWHAELDAAGRWVDRLPVAGRIVEVAAGTGWWSPLLAEKGELWSYDANDANLDAVRDRLQAHGLRAHLHRRDPWAPPDGRADTLFAGFWLARVPRGRLDAWLRLAREWLTARGTFAAVDLAPDRVAWTNESRSADGRDGADWPASTGAVRYRPDELRAGLLRAGFAEVDVSSTGTLFLLIRARA